MPVICAADEHYALPLAVMLESLGRHANPEKRVDVYLVDCGITRESRERIVARLRPNLSVQWCPSLHSSEFDDPFWGHVSGATYERLLIDHYLPGDARHALWLDCDLLILDDITQLFSKPLSGEVLLAVRDPLIQNVSSTFGVHDWRALGLEAENPYFNAGVMLIDMDQWRAESISSRAIDYLDKAGKKVMFHEQQALNAVVGPHWRALDDRWNYSANPLHARRQNPEKDALAIVHFAGRIKPWVWPGLGAMQSQYFDCLDQTAWRGFRPGRSIATSLVSWYLRSPLRRTTYWLENLDLKLRHTIGKLRWNKKAT